MNDIAKKELAVAIGRLIEAAHEIVSADAELRKARKPSQSARAPKRVKVPAGWKYSGGEATQKNGPPK